MLILVAYSLWSAVRKTSGTCDSQNIGKAPCTTKETSIVESVSVNSSGERFRGAQRELHTVLIAYLAHYNITNLDGLFSRQKSLKKS